MPPFLILSVLHFCECCHSFVIGTQRAWLHPLSSHIRSAHTVYSTTYPLGPVPMFVTSYRKLTTIYSVRTNTFTRSVKHAIRCQFNIWWIIFKVLSWKFEWVGLNKRVFLCILIWIFLTVVAVEIHSWICSILAVYEYIIDFFSFFLCRRKHLFQQCTTHTECTCDEHGYVLFNPLGLYSRKFQ